MVVNFSEAIVSENIEYDIAGSDDTSFNGTSLQSTVTTTYSKLENLFGKPSRSDADPYEKVNMEWMIDAKVFYTDEYGDTDWHYIKATVYNWKTGYVPTEEYDWHIGGNDWDAVELVEQILEGSVEPDYNWND